MTTKKGAARGKRATPTITTHTTGRDGTRYYIWHDADGNPKLRVKKSPDGQVTQQRWEDGRWKSKLGNVERPPLFNYPAVIEAIRCGTVVWVTEGEPDAQALIDRGYVATTNLGGAGKWRDACSQALVGVKQIRLAYDDDDVDPKTGKRPGHVHAWQVHTSLRAHGIRDVRFVRPLEGKDIRDHLDAGHGLDELVRMSPDGGPLSVVPSPAESRSGVYERAVAALTKHAEGNGLRLPTPHDGKPGYETCCPAHDDHRQSLGIAPGDDVPVVVCCQAGCSYEEIARALDMDPREFMAGNESDEALVADRVRDLRIRDEAKRRYAAEVAVARFKLPPIGRTLADDLADPPAPIRYVIDQLHPEDTNSLFIAAYTTGKTTAVVNLAKCLADGLPFLGKYEVDFPEGRIGYWNYEMPRSLMDRWFADADIQNLDRIVKLDLRGQRMPLNAEGVADQLAEWLQGNDVRFLIIDVLAKANVGFVDNENDNMQARDFTDALDELYANAGVRDSVVTTHMGRYRGADGSETSRGATRYQDWADASWFLNKNEVGVRSLWADGRDVEIRHDEAIVLGWDERTRRVYATGQTKREAAATHAAYATVTKLEELGDGVTSTELRNALTNEEDRKHGIAACKQLDWIRREQDGRSLRCYLTDDGRDRRVHLPGGDSGAEQ